MGIYFNGRAVPSDRLTLMSGEMKGPENFLLRHVGQVTKKEL